MHCCDLSAFSLLNLTQSLKQLFWNMVPALVMQIPQHDNIIPTSPSMEFFNRILHSPRILRERKIIAIEEKTQHVILYTHGTGQPRFKGVHLTCQDCHALPKAS
jgi:hypothetical protein